MEIKEKVLNELKGKEVRGIYKEDGSFGGKPDCYKFKDISDAFDKIEIQRIKKINGNTKQS